MTRFVVLNDNVAVYATDMILSNHYAEQLSEQFRRVLPDWRVLILDGPSEVVDLRGQDDLAHLATELHDRLTDQLVAVK